MPRSIHNYENLYAKIEQKTKFTPVQKSYTNTIPAINYLAALIIFMGTIATFIPMTHESIKKLPTITQEIITFIQQRTEAIIFVGISIIAIKIIIIILHIKNKQ